MPTSSIKVNYYATAALLGGFIILYLWYNSQHSTFGKAVSLRQLLSASVELAERGGFETVRVKSEKLALNAESKGLTEEGAKEMKTDGDMASHRAIIAGFAKAFPSLSDRIVSEEHDAKKTEMEVQMPNLNRGDIANLPDEDVPIEDITVWIDPLDATQEYTENLDNFVTVMVCVAVKGVPTIGVVRRPFSTVEQPKETVWAWNGKGMSENLKPTGNDAPMSLEPRVIVSRSHSGDVQPVVETAFDGKGAITPAGGAGYKAIEVIRGRQDVYVHVTAIKKWDICAGDAILRAVGGKMRTLEDEEINYDKAFDPKVNHGLLSSMSSFSEYMTKLAPGFLKSHGE